MKIITLADQLLKKYPRRIMVISIVFFLTLAVINRNLNSKSIMLVQDEDTTSIDTFIPNGFALVPIEIQNLSTLDSIIGQFAIVDLYNQGSSEIIAQDLKLIRSPKDPSQFAVLVAQQTANSIVKRSQNPFHIVIKNPRTHAQEIVNIKKSSRIIWEN